MKKLSSLTAAAIATLALVGCSQDGVINEAPSANQAIEFGTYLGRDAQGQTRATATDISYLKGDNVGFGVFAYYTQNKDFTATNLQKPNFMDNEQVTYNTTSSTWTYAPVKYWPNNETDKVSFFAYAPWKENTTTNSFITYGANALYIEHTVNNTITGDEDKSQDLLYAEIIEEKTKDVTKKPLNDPVTFNFKHALARIGFTVQGAIDATTPGGTIGEGTTITVKKVMLSGGTHTYTDQENVTLSSIGAFYNSAKLDLLTGNWSDKNPENKLLFTLEPSKHFVNKQVVTLSGDQTSAKTLNNENSYLMIIPQDFSTGTDKMYVYVEYTVTTTDGSLDDGKSEITNHISTQAKINFVAGNAYNINLVLGMNSVDIEASDAGWSNVQEQVDLPKNEETASTEDSGAGA